MAEKIKFKASIKELAFEYEGTREVGQALQAGLSRSLAGLVDMQRTVMLPAPAYSGPRKLDHGLSQTRDPGKG